MDLIETQCKHGITLINGAGCVICSGKKITKSVVSVDTKKRGSATDKFSPGDYDVVQFPT